MTEWKPIVDPVVTTEAPRLWPYVVFIVLYVVFIVVAIVASAHG